MIIIVEIKDPIDNNKINVACRILNGTLTQLLGGGGFLQKWRAELCSGDDELNCQNSTLFEISLSF